jgi:hypothetical protein
MVDRLHTNCRLTRAAHTAVGTHEGYPYNPDRVPVAAGALSLFAGVCLRAQPALDCGGLTPPWHNRTEAFLEGRKVGGAA